MSMYFTNYGSWKTVTPSDTVIVSYRAFWIGGAGNLILDPGDGTGNVTFAVIASQLIPVSLNKGFVKAASTATVIVGLN